jgi:solute carrier family 10 (sodium/bile acid cotransporter), member 7
VALLTLLVLVALMIALLLLVMASGWMIGGAMGFNRADRITLLFCGSKKSLASGIPMARVIMPGAEMGMALLPLMLFHQIQLMVCAALARHWSLQKES